MEIRPLLEGEERAWIELDTSPLEIENRLQAFLDRRSRCPEDPLCHVVAKRGDRVVAKLRGTFPHPGLYIVNFARISADERLGEVGEALLKEVLSQVQAEVQAEVQAIAWEQSGEGEQRYPDLPRQGTVLKIGVVPEWRGQGFGVVLHAAALAILADQGVEEYVGSTSASNRPMLEVFERNGCPVIGIRRIYRLRAP